jgi:putative transposase
VDNPAYYRQSQAELRRVQRSLARKQPGGQNRRKALHRVQRLHEHTANQRRDYAHKLARQLVSNYDRIALEDLQIANMVRNRHLSKSILDSGWYLFRQVLTYKAESAGREIALVNPAYTSMRCSNCGTVFPDFDLSTRWVTCGCGLSLDRDHNAARAVLHRAGWDTSVQRNVEVGNSCVL